jgi:hypothetical protein
MRTVYNGVGPERMCFVTDVKGDVAHCSLFARDMSCRLNTLTLFLFPLGGYRTRFATSGGVD